jgi:hypothetical protein
MLTQRSEQSGFGVIMHYTTRPSFLCADIFSKVAAVFLHVCQLQTSHEGMILSIGTEFHRLV